MLHLDQGSQFIFAEFLQRCWRRGISTSMNGADCPYDNVTMEHYYNMLEIELIYQYCFENAAKLDYAISEFSYYWCNQMRTHTYNGYLTTFEKKAEGNIKQWCYKKS